MSDRSRVVMLIACALQVLVVAGSIAWVAITGSGTTTPVAAETETATTTEADDTKQRHGLAGY